MEAKHMAFLYWYVTRWLSRVKVLHSHFACDSKNITVMMQIHVTMKLYSENGLFDIFEELRN
jgi:hypothetical protein